LSTRRLRILITNNSLAQRGGSELYVRDLAIGLAKLGHEPFAYSTNLGEVADDMRAVGLPVVDDLNKLSIQPDIIHGHHHLDTMAALAHFTQTPAIFVCHGARAWEEAAPHFPRILRYVAVDHACRDRLIREHTIPENRIRLIFNFVDLDRFKSRSVLPARPKKALILSNYANKYTHVETVREACNRAGISLDVRGYGAGRVTAAPEMLLPDYDLVFAKGRSALEALAVGAAVILCDAIGAGGMVTTENVERLRPLNFGFRALDKTLSVATLAREIDRYDPDDARRVSQFIRGNCGRASALSQLLTLYDEVLDEHRLTQTRDSAEEWRATAAYLRGLPPRFRELVTLKGDEIELNLIKNSRSWRLITRYANAKKKVLDVARRVRPADRNGRASHGRITPSAKDIFSEIYRTQAWGAGESVSGPGSTVARAAAFKDELEGLLNRMQIKSLLDSGCGDFNWMRNLGTDFTQYIGIDIVREIVAANQQAYGSDIRTFVNLDISSDRLPHVDLILCRDCLVHLSFKDIFGALKNFKQSNSKYLLTTTFSGDSENADIPTGGWRQLNLLKAPFNFPEPIEVLDEKRPLSDGSSANKYLGLWSLKDIL
jgi:Glycosyltransferase Family 4